MPVGAAVGAVAGAVSGPPAGEVAAAHERLVRALAAVDVPVTLREEVLRLGSDQAGGRLAAMVGQGAEAADGRIDELIDLVVTRVALHKTVLPETRLSLPDADLWLELRLEAEARVVRALEGEVLDTRGFRETGPTRTFSVFAAERARVFEQSLREAVERLAARVVNELFPRANPPVEPPERADGEPPRDPFDD